MSVIVPVSLGHRPVEIFQTVWFAIALAALSFLIYAGLILMLPQLREARYCCEQSSVAAAASNVMYEAPFGTLYSGVFNYFITRLNEPLELTLQDIQKPQVGLPASAPGELWQTTRDGNGVGYPLVATIAFRTLGMHTWALTLVMLGLMALSSAVFLLRFSRVAAIVLLYFVALTLLLFAPIVWNPTSAIQIAVGGIRYFSVVGVLPMFHIVLELIDPHGSKDAAGGRDLAFLAIQMAILTLVMLVRGSAVSQIGAIAVVWLALLWKYWRDRWRRRILIKDIVVMTGVGIVLLAIIAASVPRDYLTEGRFGTVVWMRVTESLGLHPAWPFPGTREMFDCKGYPGLEKGASDNNGACIYFDYLSKRGMMNRAGELIHSNVYETALREAFFKIAARYPIAVLKTFVYYKPLSIISSIQWSFRIRLDPYPAAAVALFFMSIASVIVFFAVAPVTMSDLKRLAGVALLLALSTLPAYFAAWASPHTSIDLFFYCVLLAELVAGTIVVSLRSVVNPPRPALETHMPATDLKDIGGGRQEL